MPHTGAQDQSRSEHFLQNGGCTVEAQDSGLLDGVVVLIEGEGAGDAIDGAACDSIDDGLLIVVIAGGQIAHRGTTEEIFPLILADTLGSCPVLERKEGAQ